MGRYVEWDDVIDRYPVLDTLGGADELSSGHIVYAEAYIDSRLANHYTVPFSNNNMTVRDLVIDDVYWRAGKFKLDDAKDVRKMVGETINMLHKGEMTMIDTTGNIIDGIKKKIGLHSTTESYHSSFGMDTPENWHIDQDLIGAERDKNDG